MHVISRLLRASAPLLLVIPGLAVPALAQDPSPPAEGFAPLPAPQYLDPEDPWIYRGTDIPQDTEWLMGELPNGVRYAVRENGVPADQVAIRVRIDAGSLYEEDDERGFAHLVEHLTFRESTYFGNGEAIPWFQRLGAGLGNDTNATTSPTATVYQLDLPNARPATLENSMRLFAGMIRNPALSEENLKLDVPIVLAEMRERNGPDRRIADATHSVFFDGQRLAERSPIGTVETLQGATSEAVKAFHQRWYRPENAVVVMVGDMDPQMLAALVERYFGDWEVPGPHTPQPDFGAPAMAAGADPANPVDLTRVVVEPGQPRSFTYAWLRPYVQVVDNLEYNRGWLTDALAVQIINRRLETRARAGASFLYAGVETDKTSRSAEATYVAFAPLGDDWETPLAEVRAVIADALATPPSQDEIDREVEALDVIFQDMVGQAQIQAGTKLADDLVNAVDIREAVASPETFLTVFREMNDRFTPATIYDHTQRLFTGEAVRALYLTPEAGEASDAQVRAALLQPVSADDGRVETAVIRFEDLEPIGPAQAPVASEPLGLADVEVLTWENGVKAMLYNRGNEPGRVTVRVRFGAGWQGFAEDEGVYASLGQMALVQSGQGELDQNALDRIAAGSKVSFDFGIEDGVFSMEGQTRPEDLSKQLYLFADKLADPRWDPAPVERAKATGAIGYGRLGGDPMGVLNRDLQYYLTDKDPRFATPTPDALAAATPEKFREVWSRLLAQGPIEVSVFGDVDRDVAVNALNRTFGALPARENVPDQMRSRLPSFPDGSTDPVVLTHSGDANQAAAVIAWPTGGGSAALTIGRKLDLLSQIFSNRLLDGMRERSGNAYSPMVSSQWPKDIEQGGLMFALVQMEPAIVPAFFAEAQEIAADLVANGPTADELARVVEPVKQMLVRAESGHQFWLNQLEGTTFDPNRALYLRTIYRDYADATPEEMRIVAERYLQGDRAFKLVVLPQPGASAATGR